ncbi:MAG: dihydrolipoamide acetyltransferase family protein [Ktedonobacterales bacterium]
MFTVVMPKMGDTMEEGKILTWRKHEGDAIKKGDALAEIETEKVNIEAEAFAAGVLRKILAPEGATLPVGAAMALIGDPSEPLPDGESGTPGALMHGETHANAAPQPAAQPAVATAATTVATSGLNGNGASNGVYNDFTNYTATTAPTPPETATTSGRLFVSPIARRIAAEHNVDLARVHGSGPGGRIIRDDVEAALEQQETGQQMAITPAMITAASAPVSQSVGADVEAVPLSQMRKTIARRLQQSMQTAPHFYVTVAIDATKLGEFRSAVNEYAATLETLIKVSYNDLIVKAVAQALTHLPQVNVSFDGESILYKKQVNVGVAVALEQGLIVPVVRDADKRGVLEIARESRRLTDAARAGKLKPEELQGGTFTVSNLGMYDVESFTAIINPPESAILAVGAITPTPVATPDRQVVVRDQLKVTLSSDHRALDGAVAARFLQELKRLLEQPLAMLL